MNSIIVPKKKDIKKKDKTKEKREKDREMLFNDIKPSTIKLP